jgi:hypothetical protein
VVEEVSRELAAQYGEDPNTWLGEGNRIRFEPGFITETMRSTNRPTYQQVLEFAPTGGEG